MSAPPRNTKPRKGPDAATPAATRGRGAWRGGAGPAHGGPGFAPAPGRQFGSAFPPLQPAHHFMLTTLVNSPVLLTTRTNQRLEGILASAADDSGTPGAVLRNARDVANAGAPVQETIFIAAQNITSCVPAQGQPGAFRTDGDISASSGAGGPPRSPWNGPPPPANANANVDELTFGTSSGTSQPWDQFQANKDMFGVVTSFNEEAYTTALDRNAPDFKEKERKAEIIAKEIMAGSTNNSHMAEERGAVDDSGMNEEDKYSSVVRGQNAYVPPGARRGVQSNGSGGPSPAPTAKSPPVPTSAKSPPPANANNAGPANTPTPAPVAATPAESKPEVPKLAINGTEANSSTPAKAGENNLVGSFREFVTNEKQRLAQKKQAIVKSEKEKRMAELVAFSQNFKLNKPIPKDLVPILTKDSEKAKAIVEKSSQDAASVKARNIGGAAGTSTNPSVAPTLGGMANASSGGGKKASGGASASKPAKMVIQAIPPFNPNKAKAAKKDGEPGAGLSVKVTAPGGKKEIVEREPSPTSAAFRLNVNASSFRPGHGGSASVSAGPTPSPKTKAAVPDGPAAPPNPFYGTKTFKKTQMTMLKEEFNPFKFAKVADASSVPSNWPYTGRKFMLLFSAPTVTPQPHQPPTPQQQPQPQPQPQQQPQPPQQQQPPQQPPHPQHPPPPPMQQQTPPVPGPYEDDHSRSPYMPMYPYAYQYPGQPPMQPMMQVPPSSGPPGYMQGPYMQPMPYPPHQMPPNQPMYGAPMPGMPHIAYMPPPGPYPPGAAPRGSMPPPHGYYHQSPQMGHAVPYPMMMQGPPGAPTPHPYDPQGPPNGPPGPLGVGH